MSSPYQGLPRRAFWNRGVARHPVGTIGDLYRPKFAIEKTTRIAAAGSCFAQHITRHLKKRGYTVLDAEPPIVGLDRATAMKFGYGLYSARYGNIYTVRQLLQLIGEAQGEWTPTDYIWEKQGRFYDALRPAVEPMGLDSAAEVAAHRTQHLAAVRELLAGTDLFIFTLGLTEAWIDAATGTVYATAPETIAGTFDPARHRFHNFTHAETLADFVAVRAMLKKINPHMRFLITVSPVPLTATASGDHVLPATIYSKSTLRSVAGDLATAFDDIDYFPSYELIGTPFTGNIWFDDDRRSVADAGVEMVMRHFFTAQPEAGLAVSDEPDTPPSARTADDVVCEDVLLEAFS